MRTWLRAAGALAMLLVGGCADEINETHVPGTTYRLGKSTKNREGDLAIKLYTNEQQCLAQANRELEDCMPHADRATGQVHLSFQLEDPTTSDARLLPLTEDHIEVLHQGTRVAKDGQTQDFELIPHEPTRAGQLFIVLIDGSSSMFNAPDGQRPVIEKVDAALRDKEVVDKFFPADSSVPTGVVLARFQSTSVRGGGMEVSISGLDGGPLTVMKGPKQYRKMVRDHLLTHVGGFTFFYDAVRYAVGPLLEEEDIKKWMELRSAEPTIIAMTDGFNNEAPADTCADNAERLTSLLTDVARTINQVAIARRPRIYTVGMGTPIEKAYEHPDNAGLNVSPRALCPGYTRRRIDSDLENDGIDNISLEWIADVGRGTAFVANDKRKLAGVFQAAAATRYRWYELWYRVDGFFHRRSFKSTVLIKSFAKAESSVEFYPSPWFDAPSGEPDLANGGWVVKQPMKATGALVMPLLGLLVLLGFLGPANNNASRAIFRRSRKSPRSQPPQQPQQ